MGYIEIVDHVIDENGVTEIVTPFEELSIGDYFDIMNAIVARMNSSL
jgi:hypothetical protein